MTICMPPSCYLHWTTAPPQAVRTVTALPACRYDAVTTSGHLQWQDTVNDLDRPFFDAADGSFMCELYLEGGDAQPGCCRCRATPQGRSHGHCECMCLLLHVQLPEGCEVTRQALCYCVPVR